MPGITRHIDIAGAVLVTGAVMIAVYTIVEAANYGWGSAHTLGLGAVAVALLGAFVAREATAHEPLIPLRVFRVRDVAGANLVQLLMVSSLFGMFFLGVLFMQHVLGYSAIATGVGVPAGERRDRRPVARVLGPAEPQLRAEGDTARRARDAGARPGLADAGAGPLVAT